MTDDYNFLQQNPSKLLYTRRHTHHGDVSTCFISECIPTSTINSKQRTYVSCINFVYILKKEKKLLFRGH